MRTSYSPQSELSVLLGVSLLLSELHPIVARIVRRVWPRAFGAYGPTVAHTFLWFITSGLQ